MKRFLIPSFIAAGLVAPQDNSFAFQGIDNNFDKEAEKEEEEGAVVHPQEEESGKWQAGQ